MFCAKLAIFIEGSVVKLDVKRYCVAPDSRNGTVKLSSSNPLDSPIVCPLFLKRKKEKGGRVEGTIEN